MLKGKLKQIVDKPQWEYFIGFIALCAVVNLVLQHANIGILDANALIYIEYTIIAIFAVDYGLRLWVAENKWSFFKSNIIELIAIIPFSSMFQSLRILRLVRLLILFNYTLRRFDRFITQGGFFHIFLLVTITILGSASGIYIFEKGYNENIQTYSDALWWALVTITTVGYGDISPITPDGRLLAGLLMLFGIGIIGVLTAIVTTYVIQNTHRKHSFSDKTLELIKDQLDQLEDLDEKDFSELQKILHQTWQIKRANKMSRSSTKELVAELKQQNHV